MVTPFRSIFSGAMLSIALFSVAACMGRLDVELGESAPGLGGDGGPQADDRGVISNPNQQVVIARASDTVTDIANRVGLDANELASYNGLRPDTRLRQGEVIALPRPVADQSGVFSPTEEVDITTLAGDAIDRAEAEAGTDHSAETRPGGSTGVESVRHQVRRGETAYSIARLYKVSVRSLADWNNLGAELTVQEGQFLIIPITTTSQTSDKTEDTVTAPGEGSPTPLPPSASTPLPKEKPEPATVAQKQPTSSAVGERSETSRNARLAMPVNGNIIKAYQKGSNDGVDIAADSGAQVVAAADGKVAVITDDSNLGTILVLRHPEDLLTVYANVDNIQVQQGDAVSRGQTIAAIGNKVSYLHFEVREGIDSVDPMAYLN